MREFVKTHVILAPLREFSRSRAASKIPFPGAQPGKLGEFNLFYFRCKKLVLALSRDLKRQKNIVFFDFSNHAGAQVPIFTPKMKNLEFARLARLSTRKWDFRRRSRPRELAQRSQDDVSLNKLPQKIYSMIQN